MKRITPEMVVEAYKATGLIPERGEYFSADGCACGLGVLSYVAGEKNEYNASVYTEREFGLSYRCGFAEGFDGEECGVLFNGDQLQYEQGHADGIAAWNAVVEAGLVATDV